MEIADLKRKLRHLKKEEQRIRARGVQVSEEQLVFKRYFDLSAAHKNPQTYSLDILAVMDHATRKSVFEEYFLQVYVTWLRDNHLSFECLYDPKILKRLGLSYDATERDIKKRFRTLVKKAHPDAGGDTDTFLWLKNQYDKLMD